MAAPADDFQPPPVHHHVRAVSMATPTTGALGRMGYLHAEATPAPTRLVFIGRAGCQAPWSEDAER